MAKNKKALSLNATAIPFLILLVVTAVLLIVVVMATNKGPEQTAREYTGQLQHQALAESASNILSQRIEDTEQQLAGIATSPVLADYLRNNDEQALEALAELLDKSFSNTKSFQIILWDHTATVGLRNRGIEPRNSIETMMLTRAGGDRVPEPEAYEHDGQWLLSFAHPVKVDDEVAAIVLLSLNETFIHSALSHPLIQHNAAVKVKHDEQRAIIFSNNKQAISTPLRLDLPFANGSIEVAASTDISGGLEPAFLQFYLAVAAFGILLIITIITVWFIIGRSLKTDRLSIIRYTESLTGLHPTQPPVIRHKELGNITDMLKHMSSNLSKSAIRPDDPERFRVKHSGKPPTDDALATPDVSEEPDETEQQGTEPGFNAPHIFRNYDIRGIADQELNDHNVRLIGQAIGSEAVSLTIDTLLVGRDGRLSSDRIFQALSEGICASGCNVIDIGVTPSPLLYFAAHHSGLLSGVMITASHNPPEYNGMKIMLNGVTLQGKLITRLYNRIDDNNLVKADTAGSISQQDFSADYSEAVTNDILIARPIKIVIDGANAVGGPIAQSLFSQLNCEVIPLFCEIDGNFPGHPPDPGNADNLQALVKAVAEHQADLGIAFDGDADRMVAVSASGKIIPSDQLLMLFAQDVVSRNPAATVVYDIKCSSHMKSVIQQYGGRPAMWKTGHANIKSKMQETGALLGGEFSGHFFFEERWFGFDDGIYAALRLVEMLTGDDADLDTRISELPQSSTTADLNIPVTDDKIKFDIINKLKPMLANEKGDINTLDGIRIDYNNGWGLVRASNTSSALTARFEAENEQALEQIQSTFKQALIAIDSELTIPF